MALLDFFQKNYHIKNIGDINWAHRVNTRSKLEETLKNPESLFIESDINISSQKTPVLAHNPRDYTDLTYDELILKISQSNKGIKLDFKDPEIVIPCLKLLLQVNLKQPVILNADVFRGLNTKFDAKNFIETCQKLYPAGVLSLGFTGRFFSYSKKDIDRTLEICQGLKEVTFPVRARLLPKSWIQIQRLLNTPGWTITIWNEYHQHFYKELVSDNLKAWIKENTDPEKTFYDMVDSHGHPLKLN
ncbi:MAG: FAM151 family protein [Patescibacteria group bacterium]|nr:FAM151 family protein [Patescibacteria group bacterium]